MNKRVTKLLYKYASISDMKVNELKKWWNTLSWQEKTAERIRMERELGMEETEEAQVEEVEEAEEVEETEKTA